MTTARQPAVVSFSKVDGSWIRVNDGLACTTMFIGAVNDPQAPVFELVRAERDVGDRIAGLRTHATPCMTIVVEGTIQLDGRWLGTGEIEVAPPGVAHGDLVVGPEGAVFAIMFAQRRGMVPKFVAASDERSFEATYRGPVDVVAAGQDELPVVLLPPRDTFTPRRGADVTDPDEVSRLMADQHESAERTSRRGA